MGARPKGGSGWTDDAATRTALFDADAATASKTAKGPTGSRTVFDESDLTGSHFCESEFQGSSFTEADLTNARFERCRFVEVDFFSAVMWRTEFCDCRFVDCNFSGVHARELHFYQCDPDELNLSPLLLSNCRFS